VSSLLISSHAIKHPQLDYSIRLATIFIVSNVKMSRVSQDPNPLMRKGVLVLVYGNTTFAFSGKVLVCSLPLTLYLITRSFTKPGWGSPAIALDATMSNVLLLIL
jgi:hypothetical protein